MIRSTLTVMAAVVAVCAQAEAAVYTFTPTSIGTPSLPFMTASDAVFTIAISDTAVRSGSFSYDYRYRYDPDVNPPRGAFVPSAIGDVQAFQSFSARNGASSIGAGSGPIGMTDYYFAANFQFSPVGQINTGSISFNDGRYFNSLSGSSGLFAGTFGFGDSLATSVVGRFVGLPLTATEVPEPAMPGVLALAFGCCMLLRARLLGRRRHIKR